MKTFTGTIETQRAAFLESLRVRGQSPATLRHRSDALNTFFGWLACEGIDDMREVSGAHVSAYQLWLAGRGYAVPTLHAKLCSLRRFFEHLEATDAVLLNPCAALVLPKLADRLPRVVLTREESRRLLDAPDTQEGRGIRDKAILELFYSTGIRLEEMARLTIHDVDTRGGFVRVNKGKFAKDRVVPMGAKAARYVREYLDKVRRPWSEANKDERALWLSSKKPHRPLKSQMVEVMVKQYARLAGIEKPVSPHTWRHSCATHLLGNGANLMVVKQLLGHRSLRTTQIYTRVTVADLQATHRRAHPGSRKRR